MMYNISSHLAFLFCSLATTRRPLTTPTPLNMTTTMIKARGRPPWVAEMLFVSIACIYLKWVNMIILHSDGWEHTDRSAVSQKDIRWSMKATSDSCKSTLMEPTPGNEFKIRFWDYGQNQIMEWSPKSDLGAMEKILTRPDDSHCDRARGFWQRHLRQK